VTKDHETPERSYLLAVLDATGTMSAMSAVTCIRHTVMTVFQLEDSESSSDCHLSEGEFAFEETRRAKKQRRKEKYYTDTAIVAPKKVPLRCNHLISRCSSWFITCVASCLHLIVVRRSSVKH
jgi:hypothetical protein